jgi:uncharacterized membrane protein
MKKSRLLCGFMGFSLLFAFLVSPCANQPAIASMGNEGIPTPVLSHQVQPQGDETIKLSSPFPILKAKAGDLIEFKVELAYHGSKARVFDLSIVGSRESSYIDILASFMSSDSRIEAMLIKPDQEFPDVIKVRYNPALSKKIEPGKYVITLRASSGNIADSIDLTAVITTRYELFLDTNSGRLNAEITAGKDNHIPLLVTNNSSIDLEDVRLSANVPENWGINFAPNVINKLGVQEKQSVDMVITPDSNTIAGDYSVLVSAMHSDTLKEMSLRITVATPTAWGWISVLIIVVVVISLVAIFLRLGRR